MASVTIILYLVLVVNVAQAKAGQGHAYGKNKNKEANKDKVTTPPTTPETPPTDGPTFTSFTCAKPAPSLLNAHHFGDYVFESASNPEVVDMYGFVRVECDAGRIWSDDTTFTKQVTCTAQDTWTLPTEQCSISVCPKSGTVAGTTTVAGASYTNVHSVDPRFVKEGGTVAVACLLGCQWSADQSNGEKTATCDATGNWVSDGGTCVTVDGESCIGHDCQVTTCAPIPLKSLPTLLVGDWFEFPLSPFVLSYGQCYMNGTRHNILYKYTVGVAGSVLTVGDNLIQMTSVDDRASVYCNNGVWELGNADASRTPMPWPLEVTVTCPVINQCAPLRVTGAVAQASGPFNATSCLAEGNQVINVDSVCDATSATKLVIDTEEFSNVAGATVSLTCATGEWTMDGAAGVVKIPYEDPEMVILCV